MHEVSPLVTAHLTVELAFFNTVYDAHFYQGLVYGKWLGESFVTMQVLRPELCMTVPEDPNAAEPELPEKPSGGDTIPWLL